MRIMGYDYGAYKKQYDNNAVKYKNGKGLSSDEFLSKMRKTDKFIPVITAVIYYGERPWDGAVSLHGMLDIPKQFSRYVNDYKIFVFNIAFLPEKIRKAFKSDFKIVADFFAEKRLGRYNPKEHPEAICHVEAVLNLLQVFTNDETYVKIEKQ